MGNKKIDWQWPWNLGFDFLDGPMKGLKCRTVNSHLHLDPIKLSIHVTRAGQGLHPITYRLWHLSERSSSIVESSRWSKRLRSYESHDDRDLNHELEREVFAC